MGKVQEKKLMWHLLGRLALSIGPLDRCKGHQGNWGLKLDVSSGTQVRECRFHG